MEPRVARELEILTAIDEDTALTQRALSERLGVALGLTNLYLKRLAKKGYIKTVEFPRKPAARKRLRYLLTPKGLAEKSRLTWEHVAYAASLYRRTRQTLRESLARVGQDGRRRIALYGVGEAAELAYLTLKEFGVEPVAVYDDTGGGRFLGLPVRPLAELAADDVDGVVMATFARPEPCLARLVEAGVPAAKCLTLRRVAEGAAATAARSRNGGR
jgi:DNA-binding MarR family transcriptional regulator